MAILRKINFEILKVLAPLVICFTVSNSFALIEDEPSAEYLNCAMAVCFDMTGQKPVPLFLDSSSGKVEQCSKGINNQEIRWIPIDVIVQDPSLAIEYFKDHFSAVGGNFDKLLNGPLSCSNVADDQLVFNIESPSLYDVAPRVRVASQEEIQSESLAPSPFPSVELVFYGNRGCAYPIAHVDRTKSCEGLTASNNEVYSVRVAGSCFNNSRQHIESACWNFKDGLSNSSGKPIYYANTGCSYPIAQQEAGVTCEELSRRSEISTDAGFDEDLVAVESIRSRDGKCHNVDQSMSILDACKQLSSF